MSPNKRTLELSRNKKKKSIRKESKWNEGRNLAEVPQRIATANELPSSLLNVLKKELESSSGTAMIILRLIRRELRNKVPEGNSQQNEVLYPSRQFTSLGIEYLEHTAAPPSPVDSHQGKALREHPINEFYNVLSAPELKEKDDTSNICDWTMKLLNPCVVNNSLQQDQGKVSISGRLGTSNLRVIWLNNLDMSFIRLSFRVKMYHISY
ncbi:hypothetical protein TNCV_5032081 [Trichonephila clavipes]|nr:hypothetical protein TNCV_5032081 [Trichonephila clavipes]